MYCGPFRVSTGVLPGQEWEPMKLIVSRLRMGVKLQFRKRTGVGSKSRGGAGVRLTAAPDILIFTVDGLACADTMDVFPVVGWEQRRRPAGAGHQRPEPAEPSVEVGMRGDVNGYP